jgi:uncharacterized SAM-binding protein YcdF (DUF218 family)
MDTRVKPAYDTPQGSWPDPQGDFALFFVLSKTIGIMLLPTNFLVGVGLVGVILLATRRQRLGRGLLVACVILLAITGFSPLGSLLLYPLEQRFPPWHAAQGPVDGIVVLGASIEAELSTAHGIPVVRSAPDRIIAAATLAHQYPNARILYSGGSPNLISDDAREADFASAVFEGLGIDKSRLIVERRSRNTQENAQFSKVIAAPKQGERWLLVTSAFHMPRSVGLFRKAGFAVEPYPVDWRTGGRGDLLTFSNVVLDGWERTDLAVREWIGLLAYRITGKIDDLFPAPVENQKPVATNNQSG